MKIRTRLALGLATGVTLVGPAAAQALPTTTYALGCKLNASAFARVDLIGVTTNANPVDASQIRYRSLKGDGRTPNTFTPDKISIELYNATYRNWNTWTSRGGGIWDGVTVPTDYRWDPSGKFILNANFTKIRFKAWSLGGQSCTSPERAR